MGYELPPFFFVFDVESIGLHGQAFAVGWVVVDTATGETVDENIVACAAPDVARMPGHSASDIDWITTNVVPALAGTPLVARQFDVRKQFWAAWKAWEARGAMLAADVPWPAEARFLMTCVRYTAHEANQMPPIEQPLSGPYPLIDIASVLLARGQNPLETFSRYPNETPAHNPLNDARQSARLLMDALRK